MAVPAPPFQYLRTSILQRDILDRIKSSADLSLPKNDVIDQHGIMFYEHIYGIMNIIFVRNEFDSTMAVRLNLVPESVV